MMKLIFVGAFPAKNHILAGGNITDCSLLIESSFARRLDIITIDSTQRSQPPPSLIIRLWNSIQRLMKFRSVLNKFNADAALIFSSSGLSFLEKGLMTRLASKNGLPVLLAVRSGHFMYKCRRSAIFRFLARKLLQGATFLLCQGKVWQKFFHEMFGFDVKLCPIVNSWVAHESLLKLPLKENQANDQEKPLIIFYLGWIEHFKGIFELLKAVHQLQADPSIPKFRILVAGEGGALPEAKSFASSIGIDGLVDFLGWITPKERLVLFGKSDVFVLPSHIEGLPNAMIEAMAAGKPVVVSPAGSILDVIKDGHNGLLVPSGDVKRLSKALAQILRDPKLRYRLGKEARKDAIERFQPEAGASRIISLIEDAVNNRDL